MNDFERLEPNYRLVATQYGDDLQSVALREMGDANRWPELVWLNKLSHPYLTDDPLQVSPTVKLNGSLLKVPAPVGVYSEDAETGQVYERDCELVDKLLTVDASGDFSVLSGTKNLKQQLTHRIITPRGQARRHANYGCLVWRLLGKVTGPAGGMLGAQYVKSALEADYRVDSVPNSTATVVGDATRVTAEALAIEGDRVDLTADP